MPVTNICGARNRRYTTIGSGGGGGGAWEDVTVNFTGHGSQFGTDGRKVRINLNGGDYGARVDTVNGATLTEMPTSAYDGTMAIKLTPQTGATGNGNNTYVGICNGIDLWNSGAKDVAQANIGFCIYYGSRYIDLAATAKIGGIVGAQTLGGSTSATSSRLGFYENIYGVGSGGDGRRVPYPTVRTFSYYPGIFVDTSPSLHMCRIGTTVNHANTPCLIGQEWIYFEQEGDYRQNRGNANGRNKIYMWLRDGTAKTIETDLTYEPSWDFSWRYAAFYEYIGGLFNNTSTANANNFFMVSHPIASVNRAKDDPIGPPPGFLP